MAFKEKWDIVDEQGRPSGRTMLRGDNSLRPGEYHLVVHIWVVSDTGEFLIQKRSADKKLMPGEWAATGGAAVSGEDSFTAAHRELYEELGIFTERSSLKRLTRFKRRNSLLDVWLTVVNRVNCSIVLQESEVAEAEWVGEEEMLRMISEGKFHNYGKEYYDTVFAKIKKHRRAKV